MNRRLFGIRVKMMIERVKIFYQKSPSYLLVTAAALHLILTVSIYVTGRLAMSQAVDQNGVLTSLAPDSLFYQQLIEAQAKNLTRGDVGEWLKAPAPLHVKVYSLPLATFGLLFGPNILSVEPLNICFYLAILFLVFKLGEAVFDRRVGFIAAIVVALWPSFLLHTTQFLKDPLYIATALGLTLLLVYTLTRTLSWRESLILLVIGLAEIFVLCAARTSLWGTLFPPIIITSIGLLALRQWRERCFLATNLTCAVLLLAGSVTIPLATKNLTSFISGTGSRVAIIDAGNLGWLDLLAVKVSYVRRGFVTSYEGQGSEIDGDVRFSGAADLIRYLPRAFEIGYLAPFPNMWLRAGNRAGLLGRVASGIEMCLIYLCEVLALAGLWWSRTRLPAWLLVCVSIIGTAALGLVVANVGALYRMRYTFFFLVIILGVNGMMWLINYSKSRKAVGPEIASA